jgi:hypothetical protein
MHAAKAACCMNPMLLTAMHSATLAVRSIGFIQQAALAACIIFKIFFMSMSSTLHATASGGQGHIAHSYFLRNWFLKMPQITPLDRILECYKTYIKQ